MVAFSAKGSRGLTVSRAASPDLPWLVLDDVRVKGRTTPVRVHTLWTGPPETLALLDSLHRGILAAQAEDRPADGLSLLAEARAAAKGDLAAAHAILADKLERLDQPLRLITSSSP